MTNRIAAAPAALVVGTVLVLAACASPASPGAPADPEPAVPLAALAGAWDGTLTYADYSDDVSTTTLTISAQAEAFPDGVRLAVTFVEPDGSAGGRDVLSISQPVDSPGGLQYDGSAWTLLSREVDGADAFSVVFVADGRDNDRPATIRHTLTLADGVMTNRKEVRYDGSEAFFERNVVRLVRR